MSYFVLFLLLFSFFIAPAKPARAGILSRPPTNLGLVGYWSMNEGVGVKAGDFSGTGNHGTITSATWTDGKRGKALNFDGTGNGPKVSVVDNQAITNLGPITIAGWIYAKTSGRGTAGHIITKSQDYGPINGWSWSINTNNRLEFFVDYDGTNLAYRSGAITLNAWHHVVLTWDGTTSSSNVTVYVDGASSYYNKVDGAGSRLSDSGYNLYIGNSSAVAADKTWNGFIDDLRIYNRVLSSAEITKLYQSGSVKLKTVSNQGLVGYWPLNEGRGARAGDSSGTGNHGSISGATWTNGKYGSALSFSSSGHKINITDNATLRPSAMTITAWVKFSALSLEYQRIANKGWAGNGAWVFMAKNNEITFHLNDQVGTRAYSYGPSTVSANQWYFVTGVFDGSFATTYINAVSGTPTSTPGTGYLSHTGTLEISDTGIGSDYMTGVIDEVRMYSRALSATEIYNLYKQGSATVGTSYEDRLTNGLVGFWTMNGKDYNSASTTAEVLEKSGRGFNGDASNTPVSTIGKLGQALKFDGVDDHVVIPADDTNLVTGATGTLSFSFWVKPTVLGGTIISRRHPCNNDGPFDIRLNGSTIALSFYSDLEVGTYTYSSGNIITANSWQHVVITKQWGTANATKLYLNGIAQTFTPSGSDTARGTTYTTLQEIIGAEASTSTCNGDNGPKSNFFNGSIDEVRLYNRALSADEVEQLYNMGK